MSTSPRPAQGSRARRVRLLPWVWLWLGMWLWQPALLAQQAGRVDPGFGSSLGLAGQVEQVLLQPDGKLLVSGPFPQQIGRLNADGSADGSFNPGTGPNTGFSFTLTLVLQPDGKILVVGQFTAFNGAARQGIARLNPDGSLDPGFNAGAGPDTLIETTAVQPDGKILVGGTFTTFNGVSRPHLARLNADGSVDTGFNPGTGASGGIYGDSETGTTVNAMALQPDGKIIVFGYFTAFNGVARNRLVRLNANGGVDTGFNPGTGPDNTLNNTLAVQPDGKIIVVGYFTTFNGVARQTFVRLNPDGSVDASFDAGTGPDVNTRVDAVALQPDGKLVVVGGFTTFDGATHRCLVRLNADGSLDTGFAPGAGPDGGINSVALQSDGKIVAGGYFFRFNGHPCNGLVRLDADGGVDAGFVADNAAGPNFAVGGVTVQADGKVVVGGYFITFSDVERNQLARLNADGSLDTTFDPGAGPDGGPYGSTCNTLNAQPDGKLLVSGYFTTFEGVARSSIARLNADGSLDPAFNPSGGTVLILQPDGKIILTNSVQLIRLNADGSADAGWVGSTSSNPYIYAAALQPDGRVIVAGSFTKFTRQGIARLNADGSLDTTFDPGASITGPYPTQIGTVAVQADGKIVISGNFTAYRGVARNHLARLNADGSLDPTFDPGAGPNGNLAAFVVQADNKVVVGGSFTTFNGVARGNVARLNADGSLDTTFNPGLNDQVRAITLQTDGKSIAVGDFTKSGAVARNYIARFNADGSLDTGFNPGVGAPSVAALSLQPDDGKVVVGGNFTAAGGQPANALARLRTDGALDPTFTAPFAPGDRVQTLVRQPGDGAIVASAVSAATASGNGNTNTLASVVRTGPRPSRAGWPGPHTQTKIKNPIVRCLPTNGSFDPGFSTDAGTDGLAYAIALQSDGKILLGGLFAQVNLSGGFANLGRLNADGSLDAAFAPTTNGAVQAVLAQPDGRILVGGSFTQVDGTTRAGLARLLADGTLDPGFSAAAGTDGAVDTLKLQSDGKLVVGGTFTLANGVARSCLARLNTDGTLDTAFNAGAIVRSGGTAVVTSVDQQSDGKLIVAGLFDTVAGATRNKVVRLTTTGGVDTSFDPGAGPDSIVRAALLQPDGKTLLGGDFTTVDATPRNAAARLLGDYDPGAYPPLGQWRILNFGQPDATGNAADTAAPRGDGVPNLLKYALNLNPQAADATPMTAIGAKGLPLVARDPTGQYLTLTFVRRQAATNPGITYTPQFGNAPAATALAANPAATSATTILDGTWERVTVTDSVPRWQQPARFACLRVSEP